MTDQTHRSGGTPTREEIDYLFERLGQVQERLKRLETSVALPDVQVEHTTPPKNESERLAILVNQVRSLATHAFRVSGDYKVDARSELVDLYLALHRIAVEAES